MTEDGDSGGKLARTYEQAAPFIAVGLQFAITIVLGSLIGWWGDGRLGTKPLLLILGTFLGTGAGFYNLYRALVHPRRRSEEKRD